MTPDIIQHLTSHLAPSGPIDFKTAETTYPPRAETENAKFITRLAPSPTGFVHIGTIYAAMINYQLAHQSDGIFLLRIEDTDKNRQVAGSDEQIIAALNTFGLQPGEGPDIGGAYGPYVQSKRANFYIGYALQLLRTGRAYPCFATTEELNDIRIKQQAAKVRPGYYGEYALWRDRNPADVIQALSDNRPFVLRFRSEGSHERRFDFHDELKGDLNLPQNDLDVPLIKADGLPTYHLAHVVDDHLMRINLVLRGDEWLPSLPLHIELAAALSISPFRYAHFAPISIIDNGNKRKLSKRKDKEADVTHWQNAGYLPEAIIEYLMTLASADFEKWRSQNPSANTHDFVLSLEKLAMSRSPLLDIKKLDDISKNFVASLPQQEFENNLLAWAEAHDTDWFAILIDNPDYTRRVLAVERSGQNQRKDLAHWDQSKEMYGFFYDQLFEPMRAAAVEQVLGDIPVLDRKTATEAFLATYSPSDDQPVWFEKMRAAAETAGYASDNTKFKTSPGDFKGKLADFAKILRALLTGSNRSPDLYIVMQVLGEDRVRHRLNQ